MGQPIDFRIVPRAARSASWLALGVGLAAFGGRTALAAEPAGTAVVPGRPAADASVDAADARAVRQVVEAQLADLAAARPEAAFAHATAAIRQQFGDDPAAFMQMVRRGYPMLIRPAAVAFQRPERRGPDGIVQAVHFRDREGRLWRAVYSLERDAERRWRIGGCAVAPDEAARTT